MEAGPAHGRVVFWPRPRQPTSSRRESNVTMSQNRLFQSLAFSLAAIAAGCSVEGLADEPMAKEESAIEIAGALPASSVPTVWNSFFSDAINWDSAPKYYTTIRYPDLNGDNRDDVCGRGYAGIWCALSDSSSSFASQSVWEPAFGDGNGWGTAEKYYGTIQYPDFDGDGLDDVCGRGELGIWCARSTGTSFTGNALREPNYSDANGWATSPKYYSTIRFPDLNGDGKADVCGRGGAGIWCALSNGTSFVGSSLWASAFSDANNWDEYQYYSTLEFPDVDGDGKADVCGRGSGGIWCARSNGTSFTGLAPWTSFFSDAGGWDAGPKYYGTIQFPDLNHDGKADVCGRGLAGIWCARSTGTGFTSPVLWTSFFSDGGGWDASPKFYSTIQFPDLDNDGQADVCGRGVAGLWCASSTGTSFTGVSLWNSAYSDANHWGDGPQYYGTIKFPDIDSDWNKEVCGRGIGGITCAK
jgi:hypothetical protein